MTGNLGKTLCKESIQKRYVGGRQECMIKLSGIRIFNKNTNHFSHFSPSSTILAQFENEAGGRSKHAIFILKTLALWSNPDGENFRNVFTFQKSPTFDLRDFYI